MDLPVNRFKRAIAARERQVGAWASLASAGAVEILGDAGFDWVVLDGEHSPNDMPLILELLRAIQGKPATPVVRPPWNDMVLIKQYLDIGVQSLLVPYIETPEQARLAVSHMRYPPRGVRGVASAMRASAFGLIKDYHTRCETELCLLVQIETQLGLDNLEAIAAVDGVDGIFIGPSDLSASLGYLGNAGHPEVQRTIEEALRRSTSAGKPAGILTADETLARKYADMGFTFVAAGSDVSFLGSTARRMAKTMR